MKYSRLYIALILLLTVLLVYVDAQAPKEIDWTRTFRNNDKNPFGLEVFYKILPEIFKNQDFETVRTPPYNLLTENKLPRRSNYVVVDQYLEDGYNTKGLSDPDVREMVSYIGRGNNVFMASNTFPKLLLDTLSLELKSVSLSPPDLASKVKGKARPLRLKLLNPVFKGKAIALEKEAYEGYFVTKDTLDVHVLAVNDSSHANFIRYNIGKGKLFLCSVPEVFSNYYLLRDDKDPIAFKMMSYLPVLPTYYDEYTKQGRMGEQLLLRYVRSKPALNLAYCLCIAGILLFILFEGKRLQRIIPVIEPKQNSTMNFIRTVGTLFYHKKDNLAVGLKKVEYLKWTIFRRTGIRFEGYNEDFKQKLVLKTGIDEREISQLIQWMQSIETMEALADDDLITFNQMIESFNKKSS